MSDNEIRKLNKVGHISKGKLEYINKQELINALKSKKNTVMFKPNSPIKSAKVTTVNIISESPMVSQEADEPKPSSKVFHSDNGNKFGSLKSKFSLLGRKQIQVFRAYLPSIGFFTIAGALCTMYICEWKAVLKYLPLYGGKYKEKED